VFLSVRFSGITLKEKLFCMIAYLPKATVQAAIGAIPLAAGVSSGKMILASAVIAVLITSPLGAVGIEKTYHKLLDRTNTETDTQ
jgi:solute carrier family 9B (sodium/hydrogen exchanger), member 1/2